MAGSIVASAAEWIGSLLLEEANALFEVKDQVQSLKEELQVMEQYLRDIDAKQQVREVHTLTSQIRKLAYDAEDVIDTYVLKVEATTNNQAYHDWFMKFACSLRRAPHIYQVGKQILIIQNNMKRITEKLNGYGVRRIFESGDSSRKSRKNGQSYHYDDDGEYIVGLEEDMSKLVKLLTGEGNHQLNIVAIVGMGGSGKTTLARNLYNHPYSKEFFDCCAWVFISQEWSTRHVLSEILRKVGGPEETTELNARLSKEELVDKLRGTLENRSYLVVLDDVWRKEALEEILPALPRENKRRGSKIIVTTRNREVIQFENLQKHLCIHQAKPLTEEDAWKLFSKIALNHRINCDIQGFEKLGKEMLRKCDGLPMAIIALAGILSAKGSIMEWQQVSEVVRTRVMYGRVGDMLGLSYDDLPYDLKPCFLYLGVFPEDCEIATGMLSRMWIAEGLVAARDVMSLEDIAMQNLEELSHRFMIQVVRTNFKGEIKAIRVHDLLHDLCLKKGKEQNFLKVYTSINEQESINVTTCAIQPRRAVLNSCTSFPTQISHLRSLVLLASSTIAPSASVSVQMLDLRIVFHNFKLLRLLNLCGIKTLNGTLPTQVGSLIHLRYLGIRSTNVTELPSSIGNLRNLLTLDYRNVEIDNNALVKIPDVLWKLMRLRNLFLPIECPWSVRNLKLSTIRNLRTLWGVKESKEVKKLSPTVKKLMIVVSTENELVDAFTCPSITSDTLHTFHCRLTNGLTLKHVKPLSNYQHLHKLALIGKIRMKVSLLLPANITVLELKDSTINDEDPMISLGSLAHLKLLRLSNSYIGSAFICVSGVFPQLEELHVHDFRNLKRWTIENGAMIRLKRLEIVGCKELREFPVGLTLLANLQQLEFFGMPSEFGQVARKYLWSRKKFRLPHNFEAIIEQCDSTPVDILCIDRLFEQLTAGVFLNNGQHKYWVIKKDRIYYNCFMVRVADLSLATRVDCDGLPLWNDRKDEWAFYEVAERDGGLITVAKLRLPVIPHVVGMSGKFSIGYLSPNVTYTIAYVIRFSDLEKKVSIQSVILVNGTLKTHKKTLIDRPGNEWIRVSVGEFENTCNYEGVAQFQLLIQWGLPSNVGFDIKGAIIEPRL